MFEPTFIQFKRSGWLIKLSYCWLNIIKIEIFFNFFKYFYVFYAFLLHLAKYSYYNTLILNKKDIVIK